MHTDTTRALLEITGEDRVSFLQGLLTQDVTHLKPERALYAALLSPQGKVQHDFFLFAQGDAILMDIAAAHKDTLLKKFSMYKLRAKVALRDASADWRVAYRTRAEHPAVGHCTAKKGVVLVTDPRAAELGERLYLHDAQLSVKNTASMDAYHQHRIALGVPESNDILDDVAMDAGLDALGAISFTKGCYVGQEVTARMHYKNIARKGFYGMQGETRLPAFGTPLMAGSVTLGTLRGSQGAYGLALLKFEEVEAALRAGTPITVDNMPVALKPPAWLQPKLAQFRAARENQ